MNSNELIQVFCVSLIPVLFAITLHEVALGWVANCFGDPTAKLLGRLTINPIKHIDLLGTIAVPIFLFYFTGFIFGWAKPVPIDPRNFKKPRIQMALVALAGPAANFLMALFWALVMKLCLIFGHGYQGWAYPVSLMGKIGVTINLVLMIFNLIPIPPLDGGRFLMSLATGWFAQLLYRIEAFGFIILLILIFTHALTGIITQILGYLMLLIARLFGL